MSQLLGVFKDQHCACMKESGALKQIKQLWVGDLQVRRADADEVKCFLQSS